MKGALCSVHSTNLPCPILYHSLQLTCILISINQLKYLHVFQHFYKNNIFSKIVETHWYCNRGKFCILCKYKHTHKPSYIFLRINPYHWRHCYSHQSAVYKSISVFSDIHSFLSNDSL